MALPQSRQGMMHVPTPEDVLLRVRRMLYVPDGCICLDPCCGTGKALAELAPNGMRYGVELDVARAKSAQGTMTRVVAGDIQGARISHESFGLMLLNPPYDDSTEGRLENVFLRRCTPYLVGGGVLVFIIKDERYDSVAHYLARNYEVLGHWRFPPDFYRGSQLAYGQTLLLARRLPGRVVSVDHREFWHETLQLDERSHHVGDDLPTEWMQSRFQVPVGRRPVFFSGSQLNESDVMEMLKSSDVPRGYAPRNVINCGQPLMPLKRGHVALTLASGLVNGCYGHGDLRHVARGVVVREETTSVEIDETPDGNTVALHKTTNSFVIRVRALLADGTIHDMVGGGPPPDSGEEGEAA
jgi:SAM-dependent methyltransferase